MEFACKDFDDDIVAEVIVRHPQQVVCESGSCLVKAPNIDWQCVSFCCLLCNDSGMKSPTYYATYVKRFLPFLRLGFCDKNVCCCWQVGFDAIPEDLFCGSSVDFRRFFRGLDDEYAIAASTGADAEGFL
jgi:hypothetical protein